MEHYETIKKIIKKAEENNIDENGRINYPSLAGELEGQLMSIGMLGFDRWIEINAEK